LSFPGVSTEDNLDIDLARKILDEDHYDLERLKKGFRVFAVYKLKRDIKYQYFVLLVLQE
jgi:ATP-dependent Lon protease